MKRVMLTGADGFVGRNVLERLMQRTDWEFSCPVLGPPGPSWTRVRRWSKDLREPIPDLAPVDYVIDLAADAHIGRSLADPVSCIENNVMATTHVMEWCRRHEPERVVHLSTEEQRALLNPYAASKAAQELVVKAYRAAYGLPVLLLTADIVIGAGQPADKVIPTMIRAVHAGEPVPVFVGPMGTPLPRIYTPVRNLADQIHRALVHQELGAGDYVSSGRDLGNMALASLVSRVLGKPLRTTLVERADLRRTTGRDFGFDGRTILTTVGEWTVEETILEMDAAMENERLHQ